MSVFSEFHLAVRPEAFFFSRYGRRYASRNRTAWINNVNMVLWCMQWFCDAVANAPAFLLAWVWADWTIYLAIWDAVCAYESANPAASSRALNAHFKCSFLSPCVWSKGYLSSAHEVGLWTWCTCSWGYGPKQPLQRQWCTCVHRPRNWALISSGKGGPSFCSFWSSDTFIFAI